MVKTYILDTNILMRAPEAVEGFADNEVVITGTTLEELDHNKTAMGERGYSARAAIRAINALREKEGSFRDGYPTSGGGIFRVETDNIKASLPQGWNLDKPDNRIISTALTLLQKNGKNRQTILVTNDTAMSIKAEAAGMPVEGYLNESIKEEYSGRQLLLTDDYALIEILHKEGRIPADIFEELGEDINENEYFTIKSGNLSALAKYRKGEFIKIKDFSKESIYGVSPKNAAQSFLMDALMAPVDEIPLVIVKGPAGTGKTYVTLACALEQAYGDSLFDSLIITRSNVLPDTEDLGFLPGDLEDKMAPLLAPFTDNLRTLLRKGEKEDPAQIEMQLEDMKSMGIIKITSMAHIRGRSIPNSFIILDEAQNTSPNQMKTLLTRAGVGTKLVVLGDPEQIDTPKLTKHSNGLVCASNAHKGDELCAQITFTEDECERSPLAASAIRRWK